MRACVCVRVRACVRTCVRSCWGMWLYVAVFGLFRVIYLDCVCAWCAYMHAYNYVGGSSALTPFTLIGTAIHCLIKRFERPPFNCIMMLTRCI